MKKTLLILAMASASLVAAAGQIDLKNNPAIKEVSALKADPDASVTWDQIKTDLNQVGTAIDSVSSNLDAVATAIQAIDLSTVDPAAFTGAQKTTIQAIKSALSASKNAIRDQNDATKALKVAANNNRQAAAKLVRKLKEQDRIAKESKR
jgi:hypothetical protein